MNVVLWLLNRAKIEIFLCADSRLSHIFTSVFEFISAAKSFQNDISDTDICVKG